LSHGIWLRAECGTRLPHALAGDHGAKLFADPGAEQERRQATRHRRPPKYLPTADLTVR
jgi:hypothetical protein